MEIRTVGIDLGKTVFNLVGLSPQGEVVVRKKFSRKQLLHFTAMEPTADHATVDGQHVDRAHRRSRR